ncbi:MAG TPA: FAD-dependent oxidoreductase [Vicinamibacteria bacterium]|nr:FAD-dependent oxidoreductase [Vicinamibacteria bacterium]
MKVPRLPHRRRPVRADVAVVGSGLPALAASLELSRRGARVAALGSSPAGEGTLGLALLGPGRPYSRVARALGRDQARLVWAAGCENHLRLRALLETARRDCGYAARGSFLLATGRAEAAELAESEDWLRDDGFPGEFLDHYMLETRFDLSGFPGAYWAAEDAEVDATLLLGVLDERARAAGITFVPGPVRSVLAEASSVRVEAEGGGALAAAALVATDRAALGLLPELAPLLRPAAPGRLRTAPLAGAVLPAAGRTADGRVAWQGGEGAILLAGTGPAEEPPLDRLAAFAARIPVDLASARRWDVEGEASVDGLPLVGRLPGRPLAVVCGFGPLSPGLAFAAARWVSDALLSGDDPTPEGLRPTRAPASV